MRLGVHDILKPSTLIRLSRPFNSCLQMDSHNQFAMAFCARFASAEALLRRLPFWRPVAAEAGNTKLPWAHMQDILPTADSAPTDDVVSARRHDAKILAVMTVCLGPRCLELAARLDDCDLHCMHGLTCLLGCQEEGSRFIVSGAGVALATLPVALANAIAGRTRRTPCVWT